MLLKELIPEPVVLLFDKTITASSSICYKHIAVEQQLLTPREKERDRAAETQTWKPIVNCLHHNTWPGRTWPLSATTSGQLGSKQPTILAATYCTSSQD
jgi:hypothetical protein